MSAAPVVSVLLPVHNGARFLPEAIASVLDQTVRDLELVVIDDGSTDATPDVLTGFGDPRLRTVTLTRSHGVAGALNAGLETARAPLVARMDGDDICLPHRLAVQLAAMAARPGLLALGGQYQVIDEGSALTGRRSWLPVGSSLVAWRTLFETPLAHPTALFRREPVLRGGGYREDLPVGEDHELWARLAGQGQVDNVREVVLRYRRHRQTVSSSQSELTLSTVDGLTCASMEALLGRRVDPGHAALARGRLQPRDAGQESLTGAVRLLADLATAATRPLDPAAGRLVRRDAARRILGLLRVAPASPPLWRARSGVGVGDLAAGVFQTFAERRRHRSRDLGAALS